MSLPFLALKKTTLILFTSIAQRGVVIFIMIIAARSLLPKDFGLLSYIYSSIVSLSAFAGEAIAVYIYRYWKISNIDNICDAAKVNSFLFLAFAAATTGAALVSLVVALTINQDLILIVAISACISFCVIFSPAVFAILNKINKLTSTSVNIIFGTIVIISIAFFVQFRPSVSGYLSAVAAGLAVTLSMNILKLWKVGSFIGSQKLLKRIEVNSEQKTFLLSTGLSMALGGPIHWCCIYLLSISSNGLLEVGIFSAFFQWYLIITFIPSALSGFTIPWLTGHAKKSNSDMFSLVAWRAIKIATLFAVGIIIFGFLFGHLVVTIYGPNYINTDRTFLLAMVAAALASVMIIVNQIYLAEGRASRSLLYAATYSTVYLVSSAVLTLCFELGANALYISILLALFVQFLTQIFSRGFVFKI